MITCMQDPEDSPVTNDADMITAALDIAGALARTAKQ